MSDVCRNCGCTPSQALADARVLGLYQEFERGIYICCQVAAWADEQWLAWGQAAEQDNKSVEEATRPLEYSDKEVVFVPIRKDARSDPHRKNSSPFDSNGD